MGEPGESTDLEDRTSLNRSTYDRIAARYAENQIRQESGSNNLFSALQDAFLASLPVAGVVADLGCGPARGAARFAAEGFRVVGMDLSFGMLSAALDLDGCLAQADLRAIPIAASALDGIWSSAALLHVPECDTDQVLGEFRRVLRAAGTLALVTALGESRLEAVPYAPSEQRWYVYRRSEIHLDQLESAGFAIRTEEQVVGSRAWCAILARAV